MTYTKTTKSVYENAMQTSIGLCMTALGGCEVNFRESKDGKNLYAEVVEHKQKNFGAIYCKVRYLAFKIEEIESELDKYNFYDYEANDAKRAQILFHIIDGDFISG
jgi:hypothetical protein